MNTETQDTQRQTRSHLMRLLQQRGLRPRTNLGQNFLIDLNILEFVVRSAELTREDVVLEVGAGTGGLTGFLAASAGHVISVELDRSLYTLASESLGGFDNVTLLNQDALAGKHHLAPNLLDLVRAKLDESPRRRLKLVANLPYSVATPVVANLVASDLDWTVMVVTVQYEVAARMQAAPRSDDYGALSVWLQSQCQVELLRRLGTTVFWPRPKVDSAVVRIVADADRRSRIRDRSFFHDYLRGVFNHRRKLLRSVVTAMYRSELTREEVDRLLSEVGCTASARAEELDVSRHVELGNLLFNIVSSRRMAADPPPRTD